MKIICPKCGIIHDEDFAPCKATLSLPSGEEAPRKLIPDDSAATLIQESPWHAPLARAAAAASGSGSLSTVVAEPERPATSVAAPELPSTGRPPADTTQPEWRREVAERLESYRARRRKYRPLDARETGGDGQSMLALVHQLAERATSETALRVQHSEEAGNGNGDAGENGNGNGHSNGDGAVHGQLTEAGHGLPVVQFGATLTADEEHEYVRRRAALRIAARPRKQEPFEIMVMQPKFDFSVNEAPTQHPQDEGRPVADLRDRRMAGLVDAAILGATCAGFFLLFRGLGGEFAFSRFGTAACLASAYLVYAQYIVLFTVFLGATPGMMLRGLEVMTLDGRPPSTPHLLWRSFGYLLSAGAVFLGFLWALWDDDHLTWQDRISQTYVTLAEETASEELVANPQES